jgi:hypothetical protein
MVFNMKKLTRADLYGLEKYAVLRTAFRAQVMAHKEHRRVSIGAHATLYFEDRLTIQYQIQEMLRAERIFETAGIEEELAAYNPLIPDGSNWKATFMIEYDDVGERQQALALMTHIEDRVWVQVGNHERVWAIADEDMDRTNDEKTSAVHFLRFEFTPPMISAAKEGATIAIGIDHDAYRWQMDSLSPEIHKALVKDLCEN